MFRRVASYLHFREGGRWIVLATKLGVGIGLAAGVFQKGLDLAHDLLFQEPEAALDMAMAGAEPRHAARILFLLLVPVLGGAASAWVTFRFAPEATGHGTDALVFPNASRK
jgi:CIC family chloride channel protein